jgi:hypothetical protein
VRARDFYDRLSPSGGATLDVLIGLRVEGPRAIEPGDLFAWRKAEIFR